MGSAQGVATMYSGRGAELYDRIVENDKSELREFLRAVGRGGHRVLEIACGSGRITLPLLAVSGSVVAVDNSKDLLARLEARAQGSDRLSLVCADILSWEPDTTFDRIVLGTTSVSLFGPQERETVFRKARRWLAPDGRFLLTLRVPPTGDLDADGVLHDIDDSLRLREQFDASTGELTSTLVELVVGEEVGEYSVTTHLLSRDVLLRELAAAGFTVARELEIDARTRDNRVGDYRFIEAIPAKVKAPYFEFFVPPRRWGEVEAVSAVGTDVVFADGSTAICAISGIWNASLGYGNEAVADAVDRANRGASAMPIFRRGSAYAREAAERLLAYSDDRFASVFYSTSGSAALDAVVKLSRQIAKHERGPRARRIVSLIGSYHGITSSSMALSGAYLFQDVYDVDERLHIKVPYDDHSALDLVMRRFGPEIAAVVVEPVLGSGALPLPDEMLGRLMEHRRQYGFMLVADEVATGFYRTGERFASSSWDEAPDMMVLSKALTNGTCAASAILVSERIVAELDKHDEEFWHGETQAGSPQSCAAMIATIGEFERLDVATLAKELGCWLETALNTLASESPLLSVTGRGAMRALHIKRPDGRPLGTDDVFELVQECRRNGVIVQPSPSSIQFMPAFTMTKETVDQVLDRVRGPVTELIGRLA